MRQKAFRLSEDQIEALKAHAEAQGVTETEVIRRCIDRLGEREDEGEAQAAALAQRDEEVARLLSLLESTQESLRTAQALQAAAMGQAAGQLQAQDGGKGRLRRAWAVLRGK